MHNLLNAPCIFCGYNGEGYYQAGTHSANCPWYNIGGDSKRYGKLPSLITALFKESQKTPTNKQSESLKCHCGSDLPTLCNACFISEGFQNAQGSL